jgi:hypothetical protein
VPRFVDRPGPPIRHSACHFIRKDLRSALPFWQTRFCRSSKQNSSHFKKAVAPQYLSREHPWLLRPLQSPFPLHPSRSAFLLLTVPPGLPGAFQSTPSPISLCALPPKYPKQVCPCAFQSTSSLVLLPASAPPHSTSLCGSPLPIASAPPLSRTHRSNQPPLTNFPAPISPGSLQSPPPLPSPWEPNWFLRSLRPLDNSRL